jgi:hypothetical protein
MDAFPLHVNRRVSWKKRVQREMRRSYRAARREKEEGREEGRRLVECKRLKRSQSGTGRGREARLAGRQGA